MSVVYLFCCVQLLSAVQFIFLQPLGVTSTLRRLYCCTRGFLWRFWKWSVCVDKRLAGVYDCGEDVIGPGRR